MTMRYDRVPIKAQRTPEGYIKDTPVITRTGVFVYYDASGNARRELRLPDEVFKADSMATLRGVPITNGHTAVNSENVRQHAIGTVLSEGKQDGDNMVAEIVIHDPTPVLQGKKELSLGYEVKLDETTGEWNGQKYDAIQRDIRFNHLAVVERGRAGNARLNLDAAEAASSDEENAMTMVKVRLDSGIAYDAAPEVEQEMIRLRNELSEAKSATDAEKARADASDAKAKDAEKAIEQARADAHAAAMARVKLEAAAKALQVEHKADAKDRDIKEACIKAVRGDADLGDKSEAYIDAAFDLAVQDAEARKDAKDEQTKQLNTVKNDTKEGAQLSPRDLMIARMKGEEK